MTRVIRRTGPEFPIEFTNKVVCADAIDFMRSLPDKCIDVIITDGPWPDVTKKITFQNAHKAWKVWQQALPQFARLTDRVVLIFGCDSDPRIMMYLPKSLPFVRQVKLMRVPPAYRGPILYDSDIAYVFGHTGLNGTDRVLGGLTWLTQTDVNTAILGRKPKDPVHQTVRHIKHMRYLVYTFSQPGELIFDPFCGSGTTLVAAKELERQWCGVDIEQKFCNRSEERLAGSMSLFDYKPSQVTRTDKSSTEQLVIPVEES